MLDWGPLQEVLRERGLEEWRGAVGVAGRFEWSGRVGLCAWQAPEGYAVAKYEVL